MLSQCYHTPSSDEQHMNTILTVRAPKVAHNSPPIEVQHIKSPKNPSKTCALDLMEGSRSSVEKKVVLYQASTGDLALSEVLSHCDNGS